MYACLFNPAASSSFDDSKPRPPGVSDLSPLLELAYGFSPLIEETSFNTIVLNVSGSGLLFNTYQEIAKSIAEKADKTGLELNGAIATDPDTAIHIARNVKGIEYIPAGDEGARLVVLPLSALDPSLVKVDEKRAAEVLETLFLWGIQNFGDFAALPEKGIVERLGDEGLRLQRLAKGTNNRRLDIRKIKPEFEYTIELEHEIKEFEALNFVLSGSLNRICASLDSVGMATNELQIVLTLKGGGEYIRTINLPFPGRNPKTFLKLLLLNIEIQPPEAPILKLWVGCNPVKPRVLQTGLFQPLEPEPDKLELTLTRIRNLVGPGNLGSAELLDTHRPDMFSVKYFVTNGKKKKIAVNRKRIGTQIGFRRFRPVLAAEIRTVNGRPVRVSAHDSIRNLNGLVVKSSGPWRATGDWWTSEKWAREEWDVSVKDSANNETLYRVFQELQTGQWYVEGAYD